MRKIAICDDESAQAQLLRGYVKQWGIERREAVEIRLFPSAESFLFHWEEEKGWDALLLDIQMPGLSGVELAKKLRSEGSSLPVVFITGVPDFVEEGYEVEAIHYLLKPASREKLFSCLDRAMKKSAREAVLLLETPDGGELRLLQREIAVIEAAGRRVLIRTGAGQEEEARAGFQEVLERLEPGAFVQCHRSYAVGLRHVARLMKEQVQLDSGDFVPVSRRLFPQVSAAFVGFYRKLETEKEA